jgi:hypothetical protein
MCHLQNCKLNLPSFIAISISWRSSSFNMDDRNPSVVWFISEVEFCEYRVTLIRNKTTKRKNSTQVGLTRHSDTHRQEQLLQFMSVDNFIPTASVV